jgi:hypothetical protein
MYSCRNISNRELCALNSTFLFLPRAAVCLSSAPLWWSSGAPTLACYSLPYCCFTAALLLLYYFFTTALLLHLCGGRRAHPLLLATRCWRCLTAALLLLDYCSTTFLLLLYDCTFVVVGRTHSCLPLAASAVPTRELFPAAAAAYVSIRQHTSAYFIMRCNYRNIVDKNE